MNNDKDLLNELILESREHLSSIEPDLLAIEKDLRAVTPDAINKTFRAIHSIKGGFGFFGIKPITRLSHAMESALARLRDQKIAMSPALVDALLRGIDRLRFLLDDVNRAEAVSVDAEMSLFEPFLVDGGPNRVQPALPSSESLLPVQSGIGNNAEKIHDAIRGGKTVYQFEIALLDMASVFGCPEEQIAAWKRVGDILDASIVGEWGDVETLLTNNPVFRFLYASVLEPDLVNIGLKINPKVLTVVAHPMSPPKPLEPEKPQQNETPVSVQGAPSAVKGHTDTRAEDAVRVRVSLLNTLMNLAGELVLGRNQLVRALNQRFSEGGDAEKIVSRIMGRVAGTVESVCSHSQSNDMRERLDGELLRLKKDLETLFSFRLGEVHGISSMIQNLDMVTSMIQENIMQTRMQPMSIVMGKFPRLIRDLAKSLGKEIDLVTIGQDVEVDKSIVELLSDPLTHLVRNSVDHGIEHPDVREHKGKSRSGQIVLRAFHEGGKVNVEIADDGAGIDPEIIRELAIERGVLTPQAAAAMSDREIQALIFMPGFSTAKTVSDLSGRGVGMDVVKTNIERMGGTIELQSEPGSGTSIILRLPLTLAIIPSLIVSTEGRRFAIPQMSLEEIVRIRSGEVTRKIERIKDSEVLRLRGRLLPLVRLADVLHLSPSFVDPVSGERKADRRARWSDRRGPPEEDSHEQSVQRPVDQERRMGGPDRRVNTKNAVKVLVLRWEKNLYGLVVDDVLDNEEIVVKPLSSYLKSCQCYAGATIMGDGKVAMILDAAGIAQLASLRFADLNDEAVKETKRVQDGDSTSDLLLFSNGAAERFALPLSEVARIEKRKAEEVESVGGKTYLKNDSATIRVVRVDDYMPVSGPQARDDSCFVIIPKNLKRTVGILASRVEDVIQTRTSVDTTTITGTGIAGSMVINRNLVILVDIAGLVQAAEPDAVEAR